MGIKVIPLRHIIESALVSFPGPSQIGLRALDSRECITQLATSTEGSWVVYPGHAWSLFDVELASGSCVWVALPGQKGFEHTTSSFVSFILGVCIAPSIQVCNCPSFVCSASVSRLLKSISPDFPRPQFLWLCVCLFCHNLLFLLLILLLFLLPPPSSLWLLLLLPPDPPPPFNTLPDHPYLELATVVIMFHAGVP